MSLSPVPFRLKYNPTFDGIRAIAVTSVMLGHFNFPGIKDGAFGVDIFFVLSGYLITHVLIADFHAGRGLRAFYFRRFLRLAPPLLFMAAVLLAVAGLGGFFSQAWQDVVAAVSYTSNWTRALSLGVPMFLGHSWSLSIEEQFYLLWPPLFVMIMRRFGSKGTMFATVALFALSVAWQYYLVRFGAKHDRIYNGFDSRFGELLVGCILAFVIDEFSHTSLFKECLVFLSKLAIILAAVFSGLVHFSVWNVSFSWIVVACAAIVILVVSINKESWLGRCLSWTPLVEIGKRSYAIYLGGVSILVEIGERVSRQDGFPVHRFMLPTRQARVA